MIRNVLLVLVTGGALIAGFFGYQAATRIERDPALREDRRSDLNAIESRTQHAADTIVSVPLPDSDEPAIISPGGRVQFHTFDEFTGQVRRRLRAASWSKAPGTRSDVDVVEPHITEFLPNGTAIDISADAGQMSIDEVDARTLQPRKGWLRGNVRFRLVQVADARPQTEIGDDGILIELDALRFDLELGEVHGEGPLRARGPDFEIVGEGLDLVWNQADKQLDTLHIHRGERLELTLAGRMLLGAEQDSEPSKPPKPAEPSRRTDAAAPPGAAPPATAPPGARPPATEPSAAEPSAAEPRRFTTYVCTLAGDVQVERRQRRLGWRYSPDALTPFQPDRIDGSLGGLEARELRLLFDVGDDARRLAGPAASREPHAASGADAGEGAAPTPRSAARADEAQPTAAQPAARFEEPERLIVRWSGPLRITPQQSGRKTGPMRRHVEARRDVRITMPERGHLLCERLEYHDETSRLWLYAAPGAQVDLDLPGRVRAAASSIYLDRAAHVVKLLGDVALRSGQTPGQRDRALAIRCQLWAELRLGQPPDSAGEVDEAAIGADFERIGALESALFAGDVQVDVSGRTMRADRLETFFEAVPAEMDAAAVPAEMDAEAGPDTAKTGPETAKTGPEFAKTRPETAETARPGADEAAAGLRLAYAEASGRVRLGDERQRLRCMWMRVNFAEDAQHGTYPHDVVARGAVTLLDPEQRFYVRGRELTALLTPGGELEQAEVTGDAGQPAWARARDYTIRGRSIALELDDASAGGGDPSFHLFVPGASELRFWTNRSLQGQPRRDETLVTVTCSDEMRFDSTAERNEVHFSGNVVVRNEHDRLEASRLALYLRDERIEPTPADLLALPQAVRMLPQSMRAAVVVPAAVRRAPELLVEGLRAASGAAPRRLLDRAPRGERLRKEPLQLVAHEAALISETIDPQRGRAVVMQRIGAPELRVDIPQRTARTLGETTLGMTSLQLDARDGQPSDALGIPSALITRGPSQSALRARRSMTYVFGEEGPERRDSVLFEGGVAFVHVTGRHMEQLAALLPELAADPQRLGRLQDRQTTLTSDRVELLLDMQSTPDGRQRSPQLAWLNAHGQVHVLDQLGDQVREITAGQIEFDRAAQTVRVLEDRVLNTPARIELFNRAAQTYEQPYVGQAFTIHLDTNTIKSEGGGGQLRR